MLIVLEKTAILRQLVWPHNKQDALTMLQTTEYKVPKREHLPAGRCYLGLATEMRLTTLTDNK